VNGRLADPQAYFFADMIKRPEGSPADDYKDVLRGLIAQGMGTNPRPGEIQPPNAPFYGITCMCSSGTTDPRGRIWLPTTSPVVVDGNAWYTHEIQVIANGPTPGSFVWAWTDKGGGPYEARPCEGGTDTGGGGGGEGGMTEDQVKAMIDAALKPVHAELATTLKDDSNISLRADEGNGMVLCAEGGGPTQTHQRFNLTSRPAVGGGWEKWKIRKA
jgi:hypothetical protein